MLQNAILVVMLSLGAQGNWAGSVGAPCYAGNTCDWGLYCKNIVVGGGNPDFRCFENNHKHRGHHGVTSGCWPTCSAGQRCLNQGGGNWQCIGGNKPGGNWNEPCVGTNYWCSQGLTCQKSHLWFMDGQMICLYPQNNWNPGQLITTNQVITPSVNSHSIHGIGGRRREEVTEDAASEVAVSTGGDDRRRWGESTGYWNQPCRDAGGFNDGPGGWCYQGLVCQYSWNYGEYTCQSPGTPYNPRYLGNQIWNGVISGLGNLVWDTAPWNDNANHGSNDVNSHSIHGIGGRRREEAEDEASEDGDVRRRWGCGFCWMFGQTCDWNTWTCVSEGGDLGEECNGNWQCSGQLECRYATEWTSRRKTCEYPRGRNFPNSPGGLNPNSIHGIPGRRLETLDFAVQEADEISRNNY